MATTRKPPTRTARTAKFIRTRNLHHTVPALAVFGVAAYQSYWHTVEVVARAGEGAHGVGHIFAIAVDGMMIVASRYITAAPTKLGKGISVGAFVVGVLMTLGMNYLAADHNWLSRLIAVIPAVTLIGTAAMLHWGTRRPATRTARKVTTAKATPKIRSIA